MNPGLCIKLAAVEVDARTLAALTLLSQRSGRFSLTDINQADAVLLDGDRPESIGLYERQRCSHPGQPILLLSSHESCLRGVVSLLKPLQIEALFAALNAVRDHLPRHAAPGKDTAAGKEAVHGETAERHERAGAARALADQFAPEDLCGSSADIDPHDAGALAALRFDPEHFLLGRLIHARHHTAQQHCGARIELPSNLLLLDIGGTRCLTTLSARQLRGLALMPLDDGLGWQAIDALQLKAAADTLGTTLHAWSIELLIWQIALWTARGRLPLGIAPDALVGLRRWPNLTHGSLPPEALRIAALLSHQPHTPFAAARRLGIPQRYVFAFVGACAALDLLTLTHTDAAPAAAPEQHPARGLLSKLLGMLRRNSKH
ncbi:hypothetical protein [Plasticicumulans acidivorans]|uniref:Uncharacterized protein n=1 Tax=Plasticicumulans acidivorans TaxID=886464 RepID=A0A317MUX7_9GAMM|nr:hypothetical protein [Plasticicumulans acidivorans]PWV61783.1 hypothetical protein C7443_105216 [Plasticicumulans acidivorans]